MQKVVIVCALAFMAFAVNAASVKWNAANIYGSDGTTKFSGVVTLYCTELSDFKSEVTASNGAVPATTVALPDSAGGTTKTFYFVFTDNGKTFTSAEKSVAIPATASAGVANFGNMQSATQNASNWSGGGIPEPSSALLLLMGGAMLALRRKQK
jgi:hypothetical protein